MKQNFRITQIWEFFSIWLQVDPFDEQENFTFRNPKILIWEFFSIWLQVDPLYEQENFTFRSPKILILHETEF